MRISHGLPLRFVAPLVALSVACLGACSTSSVAGGSDAGSTPALDGGAAADTGTPPSDAGQVQDSSSKSDLGPGPYSISYAGTSIGIDSRPAVKATFNGPQLTSYTFNADESPQVGTNQILDVGGDGPVIWGRWAGGTTAGKFYNPGTFTFAQNGGFHYAVGKATTTIPSSGAAAYAFVAATPATRSDGTIAPGTATGTAAVLFAGAGTKVGVDITLTLPGDTYNVSSTGGAAAPSSSQISVFNVNFLSADFNSPIKMSGSACAGGASCIAAINGFFAGDKAERLAVVVHIFAGAGGAPATVSSVLIFKKQ